VISVVALGQVVTQLDRLNLFHTYGTAPSAQLPEVIECTSLSNA
jgi:hypothetical protein